MDWISKERGVELKIDPVPDNFKIQTTSRGTSISIGDRDWIVVLKKNHSDKWVMKVIEEVAKERGLK